MRLLHTGDWHLGRRLYGYSLLDDQAYLLDRIVEIAAAEKPDAVIVAGDLYDRAVPPAEAVELLDDAFARLALGARVPVLAIAGNHDSAERLAFGARFMRGAGLHLSSNPREAAPPVVLEGEDGLTAFYLLPYAEPSAVRETFADELGEESAADHAAALRGQIRRALAEPSPSGCRRVAIAHAFVAGGEESESERPLALGGTSVVPAAEFEAFHYTALGHLHRPQKIGGNNIRYSGSIFPYSASETSHEKSVVMVELDADEAVRVETIPLVPRRRLVRLEGTFRELLENPDFESNREDYIIAVRSDRSAVLDPMARLRERFPHCLHMEVALDPAAASPRAAALAAADTARRRPLPSLFADFYADILDGAAMSPAEAALIDEIAASIRSDGDAQG